MSLLPEIGKFYSINYLNSKGYGDVNKGTKFFNIRSRPDKNIVDSDVITLTGTDTDDRVFEIVPSIDYTNSKELNLQGLIFNYRSAEQIRALNTSFYLNINVPQGRRLVIVDRFVNSRGLGKVNIEVYTSTDAIETTEAITTPNTEADKESIESKFKTGLIDFNGTLEPANPSIQYLGDEFTPTAGRAKDPSEIPVTFFERIITARDADNNVGFKFTISNITNSEFEGYVELFFYEEDVT